MDATFDDEPPPKSDDLAGWRRAITEERLRQFRLEEIVAAIQDLGPLADPAVINPLAKHLSDAVLRKLRALVGKNHPNEGQDIIDRVHFTIFEAILQPSSPDGKGLRKAFIPRLKFRMRDAIAKEGRAFRNHAAKSPRSNQDGTSPDSIGEDPSDDLQSTNSATIGHDCALFNLAAPEQHIDQEIYVAEILETIPDIRKRLAFRLFINGYKCKSSVAEPTVETIAEAVGISEKTARVWIKEVKKLLEEKVGDLQ